ncbi:MAG: hypothetical protein ABIY56_00060 [Dokdonella sp.]
MNERKPIAAPLPRYRALTLCIRAAIFGVTHPLVQHMARRNHELDEAVALEKAIAAMQVPQA